MKMILGVEGQVKGNPYYASMREAFPNLQAANTAQGIIEYMFRALEDILFVLEASFFRDITSQNYLLVDVINGLAKNNRVKAQILVFYNEDNVSACEGFSRATATILKPLKPSDLPKEVQSYSESWRCDME